MGVWHLSFQTNEETQNVIPKRNAWYQSVVDISVQKRPMYYLSMQLTTSNDDDDDGRRWDWIGGSSSVMVSSNHRNVVLKRLIHTVIAIVLFFHPFRLGVRLKWSLPHPPPHLDTLEWWFYTTMEWMTMEEENRGQQSRPRLRSNRTKDIITLDGEDLAIPFHSMMESLMERLCNGMGMENSLSNGGKWREFNK